VLQCVAVCCSVLQCVAVCCSALQCVAVRCSALQCVAACCSMQHASSPPYIYSLSYSAQFWCERVYCCFCFQYTYYTCVSVSLRVYFFTYIPYVCECIYTCVHFDIHTLRKLRAMTRLFLPWIFSCSLDALNNTRERVAQRVSHRTQLLNVRIWKRIHVYSCS